MNKLFVVTLAFSMLAGMAVAQSDMSKDQGMKNDTSASAPLKTIKGTVKTEGDKTTFVADKDNKAWEVANPEALKGHEGHHVQVSAHVYAGKNQIHVMSVKMLPASKMDSNMKQDNMSK